MVALEADQTRMGDTESTGGTGVNAACNERPFLLLIYIFFLSYDVVCNVSIHFKDTSIRSVILCPTNSANVLYLYINDIKQVVHSIHRCSVSQQLLVTKEGPWGFPFLSWHIYYFHSSSQTQVTSSVFSSLLSPSNGVSND